MRFALVSSVAALLASVSASAADWSIVQASGDVPSGRGGARITSVDDRLVVFGGFLECFESSACDNVFYDDTLVFDFASAAWSQASPTTVPGPRAFHTQAAWESSVLVYGGTRFNPSFTEFQVFGDLWEYRVDDGEWEQHIPLSVGPGPRAGVGLQVVGDTLYLFGGVDQALVIHADLWTYDLPTREWTLLVPDEVDTPLTPAALPPERFLMQFEYDDVEDRFVMFGGNAEPTTGNQRNDAWAYDFSAWTELAPLPADAFVGRVHGVAALHERHLVVAFGDLKDPATECPTDTAGAGQKPTDETWVLNLNKQSANYLLWSELVTATRPPPLKRLAHARRGSTLYAWGGFNFFCNENEPAYAEWNVDLWALNLSGL